MSITDNLEMAIYISYQKYKAEPHNGFMIVLQNNVQYYCQDLDANHDSKGMLSQPISRYNDKQLVKVIKEKDIKGYRVPDYPVFHFKNSILLSHSSINWLANPEVFNELTKPYNLSPEINLEIEKDIASKIYHPFNETVAIIKEADNEILKIIQKIENNFKS